MSNCPVCNIDAAECTCPKVEEGKSIESNDVSNELAEADEDWKEPRSPSFDELKKTTHPIAIK